MSFLSDIFGYVLNFFYNLINNYGIAIIIFSVLLRLILIPITIKQQKTMKKSAKLQGKMKEIQEKYKNNPEKLNQETIELYKTEKMSPFSGCFSAILQLVIILSVFWLVSQPLTYMKKAYKNDVTAQIMEEYKKDIQESSSRRNYPEIQIISKIEEDYKKITNKLENYDNKENDVIKSEVQEENETQQSNSEEQEDSKENTTIENMTKEELEERQQLLSKLRINMNLFGLDLSKVPSQNLNDWKVYIIPVLYVLTSFISIKISTNTQKKKKEKDVIINDENKKDSSDEMLDSIGQMNNSMAYMMPIMAISIASIAPLGLALYWFISNLLIIIERLVIDKFVSSKEEEENG